VCVCVWCVCVVCVCGVWCVCGVCVCVCVTEHTSQRYNCNFYLPWTFLVLKKTTFVQTHVQWPLILGDNYSSIKARPWGCNSPWTRQEIPLILCNITIRDHNLKVCHPRCVRSVIKSCSLYISIYTYSHLYLFIYCNWVVNRWQWLFYI